MGILDRINDKIDNVEDKLSDITSKTSQLLYGDGGIDSLKSTISKHGGAARANKFNVIFSPPRQSLLTGNNPSMWDGLLSGSFDLRQFVNDPRDISILASTANIPVWNISTSEYSNGRQANKFPYTYIHEDLTASFLCTNDYYIRKMFDTWMNGIITTDSHILSYKNDFAVDLNIHVLNEKHIPIYSAKFIKAYPVLSSAIALDHESKEISKVSITFAYDRFEPTGLIRGTKSSLESGWGNLTIPKGVGDAVSGIAGAVQKYF